MSTDTRFLILFVLGIIFILAGIFRWNFPTIKLWIRRMKYGEILNSIAMIVLGICTLMAAFSFI